jgi:ubiquinone/menaquinone biosynthesis C-methylase UbiE
MNKIAATGPNADQITCWNESMGEKWARNQDALDQLLLPVNKRLIEFARIAPGDSVLDIGCGCGATSRAAAARAGERGRVLGVDISAPMLERAKTLGGEPAVTYLLADAATHAFARKTFDLAISRFGVMFFADPVAAFANIRTALKPGGRLAFVCWQEMRANAWVTVPLFAALPHLPPQEPADLLAPGPFAFADAERVKRILSDAGFSKIEIAPESFKLMQSRGGPRALDDAVYLATEIGPTSRLLNEASPEARAAAIAAIRQALAPHVTTEGVALGAQCWFVGAAA